MGGGRCFVRLLGIEVYVLFSRYKYEFINWEEFDFRVFGGLVGIIAFII